MQQVLGWKVIWEIYTLVVLRLNDPDTITYLFLETMEIDGRVDFDSGNRYCS